MTEIKQNFKWGSQNYSLSTGKLARQATGSILVSVDDTVLLCTVVCDPNVSSDANFLPLTINYQEKTYAAGKIPGSFFRREGRPSEGESLISRLIDRPIRPLFPKGFNYPTQIICTLMSCNPDVPADIPALIGASAALSVSGIPFDGPLAACRVGFIDDEYVLNPSNEQLAQSKLNMVIAGTETATLMVESEANELPEDIMLEAVLFGQRSIQNVITEISQLQEKVAPENKWGTEAPAEASPLEDSIQALVEDRLKNLPPNMKKLETKAALAAMETSCTDNVDDESKPEAAKVFQKVIKKTMRSNLLENGVRLDGRKTDQVRGIATEVEVLPKTHGSSLFTRGDTQALVTATLGSQKDAALVDAITGTFKDRFLFHYNFPPYCVGETGFLGATKRREIGHGNLAKRALVNMLPAENDFPFTIRVVSEITESHGSSSMASVCGASMALMDAGIPMKAPVAGIAMGLVKEGDDFAVLSDIDGYEDSLGDMDFKVAGTNQGITALQMDIKIKGIDKNIMEAALGQAKTGRMHILERMAEAITQSREKLSPNAPAFEIFKVDPEKVREIIGKGGSTIKGITEESGANLDIQNDGTIHIYGDNQQSVEDAIARVKLISEDPEVGIVYQGVVKKIMDFGAFVEILPGKQGLVHISEIAEERVAKVEDHLSMDQQIPVKLTAIDNQGRLNLSIKEVSRDSSAAKTPSKSVDQKQEDGNGESKPGSAPAEEKAVVTEGTIVNGTVGKIVPYGAFIKIGGGREGLLHITEMSAEPGTRIKDVLSFGQEISVKVIKVSDDGKINLSQIKEEKQDSTEESMSEDQSSNEENKSSDEEAINKRTAYLEKRLKKSSEPRDDTQAKEEITQASEDPVENIASPEKENASDVEDDSSSIDSEPANSQVETIEIEEDEVELEVGQIYLGEVKRIRNFGIFVELAPGIEGLVRNAEIGEKSLGIKSSLEAGQEVEVAIMGLQEDGKIYLSMRMANFEPSSE